MLHKMIVLLFAALLCACPMDGQDIGLDAGVAKDGGTLTQDAGASVYDAGVLDGPVILGGDRPVEVYIPTGYQSTVPMPLVLFLHGYGTTGATYEQSIQITALAEERGFFYAIPEGTIDANNSPFWNAYDSCCDFLNTNVDDSGYLRSVIEEAQSRLNVDVNRIHIIGHSNGGFMTYRMACDHADLIASVAVVSGSFATAPEGCTLSEPVAALYAHGTADETIPFAGSTMVGFSFPGAVESIEAWSTKVGCEDQETEELVWDFDLASEGADTSVRRYSNCEVGGDAELWTIADAPHVIAGTPTFFPSIVDFLDDHPKP